MSRGDCESWQDVEILLRIEKSSPDHRRRQTREAQRDLAVSRVNEQLVPASDARSQAFLRGGQEDGMRAEAGG